MNNKTSNKFNEWFDSLSEEEKEQVFNNTKNISKKIINSANELQSVIEPLGEELAGTLTSISDAAKEYKTCFSDKKYEGLDIDLVLNKYNKILSVNDICRTIGVKPSSMSKYVKGTTEIPADKLIKLSDVTGISIDMLLKQKERKIEPDEISSELVINEFDFENKKSIPTEEAFDFLSNLPRDTRFLKFYRFNKPMSLYGKEVMPIYIVDRSIKNKTIDGKDPFVAMINYQGRTMVKKLYPSGRRYGFMHNDNMIYFSKTELKENLTGIILKTIIDF